MSKDYYAVLGLSKDATAKDIKKAYREQALKHHPDRCDSSEKETAQKKFQEIGEAYEVLSDPEKKRVYDAGGMSGFEGDFGDQQGGAGFTGFTGGPGGGTRSFHFTNANDIFSQFFGTSDPFSARFDEDGGGFGPGVRYA
jgi:DnaJ family protein B protein 4